MFIITSTGEKRGIKLAFKACLFLVLMLIPHAFAHADSFYSAGDNTNTSTSSPGTNAFVVFDIGVPPEGAVISGVWANFKIANGGTSYAKVTWNNGATSSLCQTITFPSTTGIQYVPLPTPITVPAGLTGTQNLLQMSYYSGCSSVNFSTVTKIYSATGKPNGYHIVDYSGTDTSTRIIDFTPEDGSTPTNPVTFSLHAYVNPDDIGTFIGVKYTLHNIDQNVLLLSAFSPSDIYFLDGVNATTSGDFYYSTTTTIGEGNYRVNAQLTRSYLGGWIVNPFSPISQDLSHQFIVGSSTFIGNLTQNSYNELNQIIASTSATTTQASANTCNPLSGFDPIQCLTFLFVPGGPYLNNTITQLKDGVLTRPPWGYLTRVVDIFSNTATSSLPTFTTDITIGAGGVSPDLATTSLTFDVGDMVAGAGALLDSIHDPQYGKTPREVFEPFVQLTLAIAVLFTIINDLTGSHKHHVEPSDRTKKLS